LKTALFGSALMVTVSMIVYFGIVGFSAGAIGRESWVVLLGFPDPAYRLRQRLSVRT
jgi:hypothetical protein